MFVDTARGWLVRMVLLAGVGLALAPQGAAAQSLAEQYPPRQDEMRPTRGWAEPFQREIVEAEKQRVPLRVDWPDDGLERSGVTFGVPFARGALMDVKHVRVVDGDGEVVPASFKQTATWDGPDGPVRWALGHAQLRRAGEYFLEFGTQVEPPSQDGLNLTENDANIVVDTGPMRVTISRHEPTLVESVTLDGEVLVDAAQASAAQLPRVEDGEGRVYRARGADAGMKVEVVEAGSQRAAIRREGWYADDDGNRFCQFVTYTYFYADQTRLRHDHTLIVAFDTHEHQIRDIMLPVPVKIGSDAVASFAGAGAVDAEAIETPMSQGPVSLIQKSHDSWALVREGEAMQSGARAGGWFGLHDGRAGVFGGLMDFWQQAPAQLEATSEGLRFHLWPAQGTGLLDFNPSAWLGEDYPGDHLFHYRWYEDGLDEMTQGYGVGKTHNLHLNFFTADQREQAWRQTRADVVEPVLAMADPAYVCATEAFFGRMHPHDPQRFPEIEALIDSVLTTFTSQRESAEQYGWINFGDVYNTGRLWRRWGSMFYGFPNVMPRLYLRSGQREAWDFHRTNTRHITDVDICHLTSEDYGVNVRHNFVAAHRGKVKGMRYGGDGGIAHYAADPYVTGPDHHVEFMLMDYYLNGNLRTWEVANYYLNAHAAARDKHEVMLEYKHRGTGGALRLFSEGYQATWDPEYLSIMHQVADVLYEAREELGVLRRDDVYMNPAKILYYQLTGDERMRELFLNDMDAVAKNRDIYVHGSGGRHSTFSGLSHAYWFTGDKKYLPFMLWQLELVKERGIDGLNGNRLARYATHGYQLPQAMKLLAEVDELPEPKGPAVPAPSEQPLAVRSNWAYYLHEDEDASFTATVAAHVYRDRPGDFYNWHEWIEQLDESERPALRLIDPDGEVVQRIELTADHTGDPVTFSHEVDGKTGTYTIVPTSTAAPMSLHLVESTLEKRVVHAGENWTNLWRTHSYFFTVPAGTEAFSVGVKNANLRHIMHYGIRNAEGEILDEQRWEVGSQPRNEWTVSEFDAGAPETDEVWSITFQRPPGQTYFRFDGVPGYVAASREELFVPDDRMRRDMPEVNRPSGEDGISYVESDLPWGGRAAYLAEPVTLAASQADEPLLDAERGTVEMWIKTVDDHSTVSNRTLLSCGDLHLVRRVDIGTYALIGGARLHRFFTLPNHRWTHLAFTWQPSDEPGADTEVRLFADGVPIKDTDIGSSGTPHKQLGDAWPGQSLSIPGGVFVGGVRASDTVRYDGNFQRPEAPFERDAQTRVLWRSEDGETAWVLGERVSVE